MSLEDMFDILVEGDIATEEEVQLVTCINGWSQETLEDILFARTGYRSFKQMFEVEL